MIRQEKASSAPLIQSFHERLNADRNLAMVEGDAYFQGRGAVHESLRRITNRLEELGIPYAVVGGLALYYHQFRRYTEDVDILVTAEGLKNIHEKLDGLGYVPPFSGSKNLRDVESGVKIEFIVTGQFPGDGKPKPVAFPDPNSVAIELDGIKFLNLPALIELKLASGMTNPGRLKDMGDVQELIKSVHLSEDFAQKLNPFVREKYKELWKAVDADVEEEL
jgi:hypothetical protein